MFITVRSPPPPPRFLAPGAAAHAPGPEEPAPDRGSDRGPLGVRSGSAGPAAKQRAHAEAAGQGPLRDGVPRQGGFPAPNPGSSTRRASRFSLAQPPSAAAGGFWEQVQDPNGKPGFFSVVKMMSKVKMIQLAQARTGLGLVGSGWVGIGSSHPFFRCAARLPAPSSPAAGRPPLLRRGRRSRRRRTARGRDGLRRTPPAQVTNVIQEKELMVSWSETPFILNAMGSFQAGRPGFFKTRSPARLPAEALRARCARRRTRTICTC